MAKRQSKTDYSSLKRAAHRSLADIAYDSLLEAIINQEFAPGMQISIDSLAKQLKMSNTPVREALMRANGQSLVRQKTNHGFVVSDILTAEEMHDLFDVRHLLEIHALSLGMITTEAIAELTQLIQQMSEAKDGEVYNDYRDFLALDNQFHHILVELSGNIFLLKSWEDLHVHLHLSRLYIGIGLFDRDDSIKEHQAIVDALIKGDKAEAVALLDHHIKRVGNGMENFLRR